MMKKLMEYMPADALDYDFDKANTALLKVMPHLQLTGMHICLMYLIQIHQL